MLIQGTALRLVARWLKVTVPKKVKRKTQLDLELTDSIKNELIEVSLPEGSPAIGKPIVKLGFPRQAMIVLVSRQQRYLTPTGFTTLEAGDKLLILASDKEVIEDVKKSLGIKTGE